MLAITKIASFRRDNLEALFIEDSIHFKEVKHFALDAEREDRILRDDRGQRKTRRKQQLVRFRSRQAERKPIGGEGETRTRTGL